MTLYKKVYPKSLLIPTTVLVIYLSGAYWGVICVFRPKTPTSDLILNPFKLFDMFFRLPTLLAPFMEGKVSSNYLTLNGGIFGDQVLQRKKCTRMPRISRVDSTRNTLKSCRCYVATCVQALPSCRSTSIQCFLLFVSPLCSFRRAFK